MSNKELRNTAAYIRRYGKPSTNDPFMALVDAKAAEAAAAKAAKAAAEPVAAEPVADVDLLAILFD